MLNGFWKLTWVETKVFVREPMGVIATLGMPVIIFIVLGRSLGAGGRGATSAQQAPFNVSIHEGGFGPVRAGIRGMWRR